MTRTTLGLLAAAAALALAGASHAAPYDPGQSLLSLRFGELPPLEAPANPGGVSDSSSLGDTLTVQPQAFGPANTSVPRSFFIDSPDLGGVLASNLDLHGATGARTFDSTPPTTNAVGPGYAGSFGGTAPMSGNLTLTAAGGAILVPIPLSAVGVGGTTTASFGTTPIPVVAGGGWTAGPARITGVSAELVRTQDGATGALTTLPVTALETAVTLTTSGLTVNDPNAGNNVATTATVTLTGSDDRTAGGAGTVQLVTPVLVDTTDVTGAPTPTFGTASLTFVPEPGTLLLLGAGVAGLAALGRSRMRG